MNTPDGGGPPKAGVRLASMPNLSTVAGPSGVIRHTATGEQTPSTDEHGAGKVGNRTLLQGLQRLSDHGGSHSTGSLQNPRSVDAGSSGCAPGPSRTPAWSTETVDQIRAWLADGVSAREISRRLGVHPSTLRYRANVHDIELPGADLIDPEKMQAAAAVLHTHFSTEPEWRKTLALYAEARGDNPTRAAMNNHARRLKLFRPIYSINAEQRTRGQETRSREFREWREGLAERAQVLINLRMTRDQVAAAMKIGPKTVLRLIKEGLVRDPPKPPPIPKAPRIKAKKAPKPVKPPPPRKLPASYVRAPVEPAKPKPVYQSVEAWLAAGNTVTRCPTAAAERTTATIPEADMAALRELYARREEERPKGKNGAAMKAKTRQRGINEGWFHA